MFSDVLPTTDVCCPARTGRPRAGSSRRRSPGYRSTRRRYEGRNAVFESRFRRERRSTRMLLLLVFIIIGSFTGFSREQQQQKKNKKFNQSPPNDLSRTTSSYRRRRYAFNGVLLLRAHTLTHADTTYYYCTLRHAF